MYKGVVKRFWLKQENSHLFFTIRFYFGKFKESWETMNQVC